MKTKKQTNLTNWTQMKPTGFNWKFIAYIIISRKESKNCKQISFISLHLLEKITLMNSGNDFEDSDKPKSMFSLFGPLVSCL